MPTHLDDAYLEVDRELLLWGAPWSFLGLFGISVMKHSCGLRRMQRYTRRNDESAKREAHHVENELTGVSVYHLARLAGLSDADARLQ